ncbi:pyridoxal phosphate-dependent decarboxylase family protein [Ohtaekwangia kribbensis]|jgi:glutamate/tyrosine decarboxylase-like PLP-dependent enzyme|uniref:Pyridoxal phosphate-dependent decarboxylase family protein n=1 Tax=Ohtaekwangia kribbensis TaxID=688913 RepID=A0ABW3K2X5_9BACT
MHQLLENDKKQFKAILHDAVKVAEEYLERQNSLPPGRFVKDIVLEDLPLKGENALKTIQYFKQHYAPYITNSAGPRYFGFVTGGSTPAAVAGDWLVSAFDQNACGSNDTIAPQVERQTIHYFKQLFGLDDAYFGSFVTGATVSNQVGLTLGRQWVGEQLGIDFSLEGVYGVVPVKVVSATPHSSVLKSMAVLGMGKNTLVKIDTLPDREAIDILALEKYLQSVNSPVIVVANAGTVNTVDFDDLEAIGKLKAKYNFWLHVDAAFGGFAALSEKYAHLMQGINHADSITIDAHKWLNVPYDAAMQFTRHKKLQLKVFQNSAAYLGDPEQSPDYFHYTPENSRRWRALPSWFTIKAYGKEGHREIVERNSASAYSLGEKIKHSEDFKLLAPVRMNVVCFTLKKTTSFDEVRAFLNAVRDDGRVFFTPTLYKGTPAIRAAISNWQTTEADIQLAFDVLKEVLHAKKKITVST